MRLRLVVSGLKFMAKGQPSPGHACPASGRQQGQVRKCINRKMWSARFQFRQHGDSVTMDGPMRVLRADAEKDRQLVVAAMREATPSSKVEAAMAVVKHLRGFGPLPLTDVPGSARTIRGVDVGKLAGMNKMQLRDLADKTHVIARRKKNKKGNWVPKTCGELKDEFHRLISAQALPGSKPGPTQSARILKHPAASKAVQLFFVSPGESEC